MNYEIQSKCACDLGHRYVFKESKFHHSNVVSFSMWNEINDKE